MSKERDDVISGRNGKNQEDNDVIQKLKKKVGFSFLKFLPPPVPNVVFLTFSL